MKLFISHSEKNKEIVLKFVAFLKSLSRDIKVFCSSEKGAVQIGKDFIETTFEELNNADYFIPIMSKEFYESRFCMIELGVAYSYILNKYKGKEAEYIIPFALYPVKGEALSGTPLAKIQVGELCEAEDIKAFYDMLVEGNKIKPLAEVKRKIHAFKYELDKILLERQDIVERARINMYFDDSIYFEKSEDIAIAEHDGMKKNIVVNFNMNPYEKADVKKPSFISLVVRYVDLLDLGRYLDFREDAGLCFTLTNFTNSLKRVFVEFKHSDNHIILETYCFEVRKGENCFRVPLVEMRSKALSRISEICFVIHPEDIVEDEGMFKLSEIEVK